MPSRLVQDYAFEDVICNIAGEEVGGYGEDGGLEFEFPEDMINDAAGAGGEVYLSKNSDHRVYVDVTVMQGTQSAARLGALAIVQRQQRGSIPRVPFFMKSTTTQEVVADDKAVMISQPEPNQNAEISERVFRFLLPNAAGQIVYGDPFGVL